MHALIALLLLAQEPATIRGVVRDALTGTPMAGVTVRAGRATALSDPHGAYAFRNLTPGEVRIEASGETAKSIAPKNVTLAAGQELTVDFPVQGMGRISGVVTDADGKPVSGAMVTAVTREYSLGALRYVRLYSTITNDRGQYGVTSSPTPLITATSPDDAASRDIAQGVQAGLRAASRNSLASAALMSRGLAIESGRAFLLVAAKGTDSMTWYIGSHTPEGALPMTLSPAEQRERVDIRMAAGPGYCIQGTVRAGTTGARMEIRYYEAHAESQGILGFVQKSGSLETDAAKPTIARLCGLSPGEYRLNSSILSQASTFPLSFRTQVVTVSDRDVNVSLDGQPPVRASGEIVWDSGPPQELPESTLTLRLRPMNHTGLPDESLTVKAAVPGPFAFDRLVMDDYELQVTGIPSGAYIKDVTAGGRSILHLPLSPASARDLRVILAHDGARILAQVTDADGRPATDTWVVAMPADAASEVALADAMVWGRTESGGTWVSPLLAPGKYLVLASTAPVDRSVEAVQRLYRSHTRAYEADLAPNASVTVRLKDR